MDDRHTIDSLEELRSLAGVLRGLDTAASASQWNDDNAMRAVVAAAHAVLALGDAADIGATTTRSEAEAAAIASVGRARIAVAEAVLAVDNARRDTGTPAAAGHPLRGVRGIAVVAWPRHPRRGAAHHRRQAAQDSPADRHHGGYRPGPRRRVSPHRYEAL